MTIIKLSLLILLYFISAEDAVEETNRPVTRTSSGFSTVYEKPLLRQLYEAIYEAGKDGLDSRQLVDRFGISHLDCRAATRSLLRKNVITGVIHRKFRQCFQRSDYCSFCCDRTPLFPIPRISTFLFCISSSKFFLLVWESLFLKQALSNCRYTDKTHVARIFQQNNSKKKRAHIKCPGWNNGYSDSGPLTPLKLPQIKIISDPPSILVSEVSTSN